jgi:hypothetical protein
MSFLDVAEKIKENDKNIAVVGTAFIGLTSMEPEQAKNKLIKPIFVEIVGAYGGCKIIPVTRFEAYTIEKALELVLSNRKIELEDELKKLCREYLDVKNIDYAN